MDEEIIRYVSAGCAKEGGDARLALKVLTKAGELAEERGQDKLTIKDAEDAMRLSEDEIVFDRHPCFRSTRNSCSIPWCC